MGAFLFFVLQASSTLPSGGASFYNVFSGSPGLPYFNYPTLFLDEIAMFQTESEISWTNDFILNYKLKDSIIVGLNVVSFYDFYNSLTFSNLKGSYNQVLIELEKQRSKGGLIRDIELPIKFPTRIAGIIGQGGKLDVSGSQRIELGGNKPTNFDLSTTENTSSSWFPQLEMKQHLSVNLKGTVGEKINVYIDHDSEREFELENTIRLEYKGDEDEIVQSINAGNTELSLPGIALIGGATPHKGLFGIKAQSKIGPIGLTTIASKEATENAERKWSGGGKSSQEMKIEDVDFAKARFFVLLPPKYVRSLKNRHDITTGDGNFLPKQIISFHVYRDKEEELQADETQPGTAFDIPIDSTAPDFVDDFRFIYEAPGPDQIFSIDTSGMNDSIPTFSFLRLNYSLYSGDLLAIRWIYKNWYGETDTIGTFDNSQTTPVQDVQILKRAYTTGKDDTSYASWWYELKNIYSIGSDSIDINNFDIQIFKHSYGGGIDEDVDPASKKSYAELMGIKDKDGRILNNVIDVPDGLIVFPNLFPFINPDLPSLDSIYHLPKLSPDIIQPKYYILVKYNGTTREYSLNTMNITPGSEKITINDVLLKSGEDYDIDYDWGRIKFKTPLADDPNARISVDFQYMPLFQAASKNLIGMRGESKIGEVGQVSSAFMYYSTGSFDTRPRLGSEPTKILLGEAVGSISYKPDFLTKFANALPIVNATAPSSFTIQGNAGASLPNPNTRGEVYLDDMEGAKSSTSLGVTRGEWVCGSKPNAPQLDEINYAHPQWYNPHEGLLNYILYPDLPEHKREETRPYLKLKLPSSDSWRYGTPEGTYWTSLQTCISTRGMDFSESEYIELWVNGNAGVLHIDVGKDIPEDQMRRNSKAQLVGRGKWDTEDRNGNDKLDSGEGEDTGLDTIMGVDGENVDGDDGNDDYKYENNSNDYSRINGTEGNKGAPDDEDIDRNDILNSQSNYFSYYVDLTTISSDPYCIVKNQSGWYLLRIPLKAFEMNEVGSSQWEHIKYARLWVEGLPKSGEVNIAAFDVVGNKWRHSGSDSVKITIKNTYEDKDYTPPPIKIEKDAYGREEQEQTLVLQYNSMLNTEGGCYTTYSVARNFIQYRDMALWVKGTGDAKFFIRFGGDKFNYYEYRDDIPASWDSVIVDFESIAQKKSQRIITDTSVFITDDPRIRIKGNPSVTNVMRIELGVIADSGIPVSGEVYFDEFRLTNVKKDMGTAKNMSVTCGISDLASISLKYTSNSPYFKSLATFSSDAARMASNSQSTVNFNTTMKMEKFLPQKWGFSMPASINISNGTSVPVYKPYSDIFLTPTEQKDQTSKDRKRNFSLSNISKSGSKNPLLKLTLDNLSGALSYADNISYSTTRIDSSFSKSGSANYKLSLNAPPIKIKGFSFYYLPQSVNFAGGYSHAETQDYSILSSIDTANKRIDIDTVLVSNIGSQNLTWNRNFSYKIINPLTMTYASDFTNDLAIHREDKEVRMGEQVGANFTPNLFGISVPTINYSANYREAHDVTLDSLRNIGENNSISYKLPVNLYKIIKLGTQLRDEEKDSTAAPMSLSWGLIQIEKLFSKIISPQLSYSISNANQHYSLLNRPTYKYRWGFIDSPDKGSSIDSLSRNNSSSVTKSYGISTLGITISIFSIQTSASRTIKDAISLGNITCSRYTQYPNFSFALKSLERFPLLKSTFNSFSLNYSYNSNVDESGTKSSMSGDPTFTKIVNSTTVGYELTGELKNRVSSRASINNTRGLNKELTGIGNVFSSTKTDYLFSLNRSFSAPGGINFPGLTNLKFTSNLDATLTTTLTYNAEENRRTGLKTRDSKSITITPQLSYNFSQNVNGGANAFYTQQWSKIGGGANIRNVGLRFFVEFTF